MKGTEGVRKGRIGDTEATRAALRLFICEQGQKFPLISFFLLAYSFTYCSCRHLPFRLPVFTRDGIFLARGGPRYCLWPPLALRRRRAYAGHFLSSTAQSRKDGDICRNGIRRRKDGQKKRRLRKAPARDIALSAVPCSASCESGWPWGVFACAALFLWTARHFFFACGDARKRENTYHCQCY